MNWKTEYEKIFDEYVRQIIEAASRPCAAETVGQLLAEFQERAYIEGRNILLDSLRRHLDKFDYRSLARTSALPEAAKE